MLRLVLKRQWRQEYRVSAIDGVHAIMNDGPEEDQTAGSLDVTSELFRRAYTTLHQMAAGYLVRERADHTLQPTALVHEAFLKLDRQADKPDWNGKTHFQAVAARAMRQILVDHARQRNSQKRGGQWKRVTLTAGDIGTSPEIDIMALDEALQRLADLDQRKAAVVELRFFGGLTNVEAAKELGVSPKTTEADWYFARAWLRDQLADEPA